MALICGFAAIFGAAAPAGAATESFTLTSASLPGQSSITWQGPPVNPPSTPNVFPSTVSLSGQIDSATGAISGASLSFPPLPQPPNTGENPTFTIGEVHPGTATGTFDSTTGAVTLNDALTVTLTVEPIGFVCTSSPVNVALTGTWDSATQNVTLATTSSFTIPQFPSASPCSSLATPGLNASPGGTAGSVGNALSLALHGQFAPGLPTTTTLQATPNSPQSPGTSVTLTATVAPTAGTGSPTGTVNFIDNGQLLGSGTLSSGTASLTTTNLAQTTNQLTVVYLGDTTYASSTSAAVPYVIQALPTISSNFPSQIVAGSTSFSTPTPFDLTISNPAGGATYTNNLFLYLGVYTNTGLTASQIQLSYEDQGGNWCPLSLNDSGVNPPGSLPGGPAVYFSGDGTSPCGFSPDFSLAPGASTTLNMEIAFTQAPYESQPYTGQLSFETALETGTCTSSTSCSAVAPLSGYSAITSQAVSTVMPPNGGGTVPSEVTPNSQSSAGKTVRSGYDVMLIADVAPTAAANNDYYLQDVWPTGTVQFFVDGQAGPTYPVQSSAASTGTTTGAPYSPGILAPGTHTITMNYSGDQVYAPSTDSATFTVIAGPPPGTPYVCAVSLSGEGGATALFNAYVTTTGNGVPTAAFSGTTVTATGVSVTLDMDAASHPTGFNPQSGQTIGFSPGDVSLDPGQTTFSTTTPPTDGIGTWSNMSFTTTVTGSPGDVVPIGVSSISFGWGFNGSTNCTPVSQSAAIGSVAIIGATLSASPAGSAPAGTPVTLTATVSPLAPTSPSGSGYIYPGQVDFYDGSTYLGTAPADTGPLFNQASFTTAALAVGDHQLTAVWSGYSGVPSNTSNTVDYSVGTATTTALASSANPANAANPVTFTATVSPPPGASTQPTGDVSFTQDGNPIASCASQPLSTDSPPTATCQVTLGAGQTHSIVATYSGDGTYLGSASDPLTQTTLPGTNTTILSTKDPSPPGNVIFWAGVSPSSGTGAAPTGTVAFTIDGKTYAPCGSAPLGSGGGASCTVSFKANTTHKVSATYPGSSSYSGSTSNTITQTVTGSSSSTKPKTSTGSATLGPGKTLTSGQSLTAGAYRLVMQADGNLVEYQGTKARWATGTAGHPGAGVVMQKDGNLAIFSQGKAIWASKTAGHSGAHLTLQAKDGNVVIFTTAGKAVWSTGT